MSDVDAIFTVEESTLELAKKPGPSPWLVAGAVLAILAVIFGVRRASARKRRSRPAVPTAELPT